MKKVGFDCEKYVKLQSEQILSRIQNAGKLYLEFGGKLFDDYHASRVLPGFEPDSKVKMLMTLADQAEIVIVINAADIEKNKVRGDLGITYDVDTLRLIDAFREMCIRDSCCRARQRAAPAPRPPPARRRDRAGSEARAPHKFL